MALFQKIKQNEKEYERKILMVAGSLKGKHHLVLSKDKPLKTISGKIITFYTITNYENGASRGQGSYNSKKEALNQFREEIKSWNYYNTKLGKLKILK